MSKLLIKLSVLTIILLTLSACSSTLIPTKLSSANQIEFSVKPLWQKNLGAELDQQALAIQYINGTIFAVTGNGSVVAINANNGKLKWRTALNKAISSGVSVSPDGKYLAVTTKAGNIYVLNGNTGKQLWHKALSDLAWATPTLTKSIVLVKTIDGNLTAYNLSSGSKLWQYSNGSPNVVLQASGSPAVFDKTVVVGFADGRLIAFKLTTGQILWERALAIPKGHTLVQRLDGIDVTPVISQQSVYVAAYQGNIAAINLKNGKFFWGNPFSSTSGIALNNTNIFATDVNGILWAFNKNSGGVAWRQNDLTGKQLSAPVKCAKNLLFVTTESGQGYFFNQTNGSFIRGLNFDSGIFTNAICKQNTLFVLTNDGTLQAFQLHEKNRLPSKTTKK